MKTYKYKKTVSIWGAIFVCLMVFFTISCDKSGVLDPIDSEGVQITEFSSAVSTLGLGGESTTLTFKLIDGYGEPFSGAVVSFQSVYGTVTPNDTTNSSGTATAIYASGDDAVIDTVTAIVTSLLPSEIFQTLTLTIDTKTLLELTVEKTEIIADGVETTTLLIKHSDVFGTALSEKTINLFTNLGSITSSVTTDLEGNATAVYTSPAVTNDSTAQIFAYTPVSTPKITSGPAGVNEEFESIRESGPEFESRIVETSDIYNTVPVFPKVSRTNVINEADTVQIGLIGVRLTITANPDSLLITETNTSSILARLTTTRDSALISKKISFSTNFGTLTNSTAITDENGYGSIQLQPAQAIGVATVNATYLDDFTSTAYIRFLSGETDQVSITASSNPTQILADGVSSSTITVVLKDSRNNPINNAEINLSTTLGRVDAIAETNDIGVAEANLYSERENGVAVVSIQYGDVTKTTQVSFTGIDLSVTAYPSGIVADNSTRSAITVELKDAAGIAIESGTVELTTTAGTFENDSVRIVGLTNVNGVFTDSLKGESTSNALITVTAAGTQANTEVVFNQYITSLTPETESFVANLESTEITFKILDKNNVGQSNKRVVFGTTLGNLSVIEDYTDANGELTTVLSSEFAGEATVSASVFLGDDTSIITLAVVTVLSSPPTTMQVFADPNVVAVNGGTSTIRAFVADVSGNPVPNQAVSFTFSQPLGGGEKLNPTQAKTDSTGTAETTFIAGFKGSQSINDVVIKATIQEYLLSSEVSLTIAGEPYVMSTEANPPPVQNETDGSFSLNITSILSDINGNPVVDNTEVFYSAQPSGVGTINSSVQTTNGIAVASLIYQKISAGQPVTIISTSGQITDTLYIDQLPGSVNEINIIGPKQTSILADGVSEVQFQVRVVDATPFPVEGAEVLFEADPGNSVSAITQGRYQADGITQNANWGVATFTLVSVALESDIYPEINITVGGISRIYQENNAADPDVPLSLRGMQLNVTSEKNTVVVGEQIQIDVELKETTNKQAIVNTEVTFGTTLGTMDLSGNTDNSGRLSMPYTAGFTSGLDTIYVTSGVTKIKTIFIDAGLPASNIYLSADTSYINVQGANGRQSTPVNARLTDANDNSVAPGTSVTLETSLGTFASSGTDEVTCETNNSGIASAELISSAIPGVAQITATSGTIVAQADLVTIQAGEPSAITVSADTFATDDEMVGNLLQIDVAAIVSDVNGNPVKTGTPVLFTIDENWGTPPDVVVGDNTTSIVTNEFGVATTKLTYSADDIGEALRLWAKAGDVEAYVKVTLPPVIQ